MVKITSHCICVCVSTLQGYLVSGVRPVWALHPKAPSKLHHALHISSCFSNTVLMQTLMIIKRRKVNLSKQETVSLCASYPIACLCVHVCTRLLQFEACSLRQLVSKICRGRYSPVPSRYSYDVRLLVTQLFKVRHIHLHSDFLIWSVQTVDMSWINKCL